MAPKLWCVAVVAAFWACGGGDTQPGARGGDAGNHGGETEQAGATDAGAPGSVGGVAQSEGGGTESLGGAAGGMQSSTAGETAGGAGAGGASVDSCACQNGGKCQSSNGACACPDAFTGASCELPRFEVLKVPNGATAAIAVGVSADGAVVAGNVTKPANAGFRWTHTGGALLLDALPTQTGSSATAISADGQVIIGTSGAASEAVYWPGGESTPQSLMSDAWQSLVPLFVSSDGSVISGTGTLMGGGASFFRWTKADGAVTLGDFAGGVSVVGMNADGSVIVGNVGTTTSFIWTSAGGFDTVNALDGDNATNILAVSSDGSTVVGDSFQQLGKSRRVRWMSSSQPVLLDPLYQGTTWGSCSGGPFVTCTTLSHDGSVIYTQRGQQAVRWTAAKGIEAPLPLLDPKTNCRAYSPAAVALAWIPGNCIGPPVAVIWDENGQVARLGDMLGTTFGVAAIQLTSATISVVRGVSQNGDTIVGDNFDTNVIWLARVLP